MRQVMDSSILERAESGKEQGQRIMQLKTGAEGYLKRRAADGNMLESIRKNLMQIVQAR